ncbi:uncharacterized protein LOC113563865 [Drosophila erecta]|uniref:uncharacterized protein LOC113563865 n=1 Tax=Drosophila erecta TaxID=7220 RepID=UPI000F0468BD|nr:uncharacterized protein LOC113563865 [Drosophila erecta]
MIHSFMISNYLSKEILNSMNIKKNTFIKSGIERHRRDIHFEGKSKWSDLKSSDVFLFVSNGSLQYKSWFKSLMALYYPDTNLKEISQITLGSGNRYRRSSDLNQPNTVATEEYDYGDITGYAYKGEQASGNNFITPGEFNTKLILKDNIGLILKKNNKNGYDHPQRDYTSDYKGHSKRHNYVTDFSNQKKEINFKDISDIALTTLAFLSFGMFTLQVLMCIVMVTYKLKKNKIYKN